MSDFTPAVFYPHRYARNGCVVDKLVPDELVIIGLLQRDCLLYGDENRRIDRPLIHLYSTLDLPVPFKRSGVAGLGRFLQHLCRTKVGVCRCRRRCPGGGTLPVYWKMGEYLTARYGLTISRRRPPEGSRRYYDFAKKPALQTAYIAEDWIYTITFSEVETKHGE